MAENHPADPAFDFKAGDLRGMVAVLIPETPHAHDTLGDTTG